MSTALRTTDPGPVAAAAPASLAGRFGLALLRTGATTRRILTQLRRDPRTVALLLLVPVVLMVLLRYMFDSVRQFNAIAPGLLGLFPFIVMFLVTSVTTLRERTGGTLERLLTTPIGRLDLLLGYAAAFGLLSVVQALVVTGVSLHPLGLRVEGSIGLLMLVAVLDALLGTALGLFVSAFARSEFQAVQFMPALVFPQLLLGGLFVPRDQMAVVLRWISDVLPLSYAIDATTRITGGTHGTAPLVRDLLVVGGCALLALALGAATLRRRTP
ncbi:ABC transporter permease [Phaeacidiphilus oryzae]|uniref:ABC transporter permease n=1 Tax=Phaeacidiphilus oryzae TaxID=348818 RepID=UPI00055DE1E3|nr:ABC transporter permease [Phaeacidiphilus oryzae]